MRKTTCRAAWAVVCLGSLGLASAGCQHLSYTEKGAGIGGALGAGAGLAIGAATGNPRTGAAIGGLLGAGTGALIGSEKDEQVRRERDVIQAQAQATAAAQARQQRLGIADVIRLSQSGLEDQLIINQIHNSGSTFDLTPSDLEMLKNSGVSANVIAAMQAARPVSPITNRVVVRNPPPAVTTVIYEEAPPVVVRPVFVGPPPLIHGTVIYRRW